MCADMRVYIVVNTLDYTVLRRFSNKTDLDFFIKSENIELITYGSPEYPFTWPSLQVEHVSEWFMSHYYTIYNLDSPLDYCGILWTEI